MVSIRKLQTQTPEAEMKTITKSAELGKGWTGTRYSDDSADVKNDAQRQLIELSPTSVATLRKILNSTGKGA
jgi:hypothetical protein